MGDKAHLLIVDDEANTLASLSRAFRLAGHEATVCDNAARALELAKSDGMRRPVSGRDAVRSQVINVLEAQEIKETGNEEG